MILVDSSVWIEYIRDHDSIPEFEDEFFEFVTCGPVLQEVFQGLAGGHSAALLREALLALPRLNDPMPLETYVEAARIYREGRARGFTIRSSTDCLIAAIAIQHDIPVRHRDRDFEKIARFTPLREQSPPRRRIL